MGGDAGDPACAHIQVLPGKLLPAPVILAVEVGKQVIQRALGAVHIRIIGDGDLHRLGETNPPGQESIARGTPGGVRPAFGNRRRILQSQNADHQRFFHRSIGNAHADSTGFDDTSAPGLHRTRGDNDARSQSIESARFIRLLPGGRIRAAERCFVPTAGTRRNVRRL